MFEVSGDPTGNDEVWYAVYCVDGAEKGGCGGVPGDGIVVWGLAFKLSRSSTDEGAGCSSAEGAVSIDTLFLTPRLDFTK